MSAKIFERGANKVLSENRIIRSASSRLLNRQSLTTTSLTVENPSNNVHITLTDGSKVEFYAENILSRDNLNQHIGNVKNVASVEIGANISNIALIFGVSCLYFHAASKTHLWNLMPFGLTVLLLGLTLADGTISFSESIGFVGLFMLFMYILLKTDGVPDEEGSEVSEFTKSVFLSLVGLVGLVAGANISIVYAESTALLLGISELIIGLTIIALGTSLPELAATIAALKKGKHQMVVGNIIGSKSIFSSNLILEIDIR